MALVEAPRRHRQERVVEAAQDVDALLDRLDLQATVREADILIAAIGRAHFVKGDWIKPGATVIDVGTNVIDDATRKSGKRLVGDVDYAAAVEVAGKITPVPGGVGPMTIAMLMANTLRAAEKTA